MAINVKRALGGGLAAGTIIAVGNVVANLALGNRVVRDMDAWIPGSAEEAAVGTLAAASGIALKLLIGVLLVVAYAGIRPRFGPGFKTAAYSAVFAWILGAIYFSDYLMIGMMSAATYVVVEALQLITFLIAATVGARVYAEAPAHGG